MSVVIDIILNAFAMFYVFYDVQKLEMPSKAKPKNPEIIVPKIAPLFLHSVWNFGKIKSTSYHLVIFSKTEQ